MLCGCSGNYLTLIGNPLSSRFTEGEIACCVWDMHVYDNKIFIGSGDYDLNTRPTDIWAYDLSTKKFVKTGSVLDEAITRFVEIDGKLVAPGIDPSESKEIGNFYTYENGQWVTTRNLPNAVHNLDMIKNADYIIDLGPEGGDAGGEIVCTGTPEEVAKCDKSYTGIYLKKILQ